MERFPLSDISASLDNSGASVFSDQLCVLRVDASEGNPFEPCDYSGNYRIRGEDGEEWFEKDVHLYAFLPIHPRRRARCCEDGLARSVSMKLRKERTSAGKQRYIIRVSARASDLPGVLLTRDYRLIQGESAKPGRAVFYKDDYNRNVILNRDTWPLLAVWPSVLDARWSQYYILRDSYGDALRVNGEDGTPEAFANGVSAEMGDNHWVVKVPYVPDAVSLVRTVRDENGRRTAQSMDVGVVTPYMNTFGPSAGRAIVSVVMGERDARAFYAWAGDAQTAREIPLSMDTPLEVTRCKDSVDKQLEMATYFIPPGGGEGETGPVRAIFRRIEDKNRDKARPLLDGAIYQKGWIDPQSPYLLTDLKWNNAVTRPYYVAFLQQFCLHVMTYLYKTYRMNAIEWRYALPRDMDAFSQKSVSALWKKEILGFLNGVSAHSVTHLVTAPPSAGQRGPVFLTLTESAAISRYFDTRRAADINPRKGYFALNVSENSLDAALWQQLRGFGPARLKWQSSSRVAGRKMFTRWIEQFINNLAAGINDPETASLLRVINEGDFSQRSDTGIRTELAELLLEAHRDALRKNYETNLKTQANDWGSALRDKITQGVTLLMFSLGYQIGALMKTGACVVPSGPGSFTVAFGGKGSRALNWVKCGNIVLANFFKSGVAAAGALWPNTAIAVIASDAPGAEVGEGLLVSAPLGFPTGWETLENGLLMQDPYYYADEYSEELFDENGAPAMVKKGAATVFYETFRRNFPGNFNIRDLSGEDSQRKLANVAMRAVGMSARADDAFKVLFESIYDVLESQ